MLTKNKYITKILKEEVIEFNKQLKDKRKKKRYYFVRIGKCNPLKCQSACCRFLVNFSNYGLINSSTIDIFQATSGFHHVISNHCPRITIDGKCSLYNKKNEPRVCKYFPMKYDDSVYEYVKKVCGYKFIKKRIKC
jgi:hypothetical protein